jgi:4'-phosphopantetheinyl transferase
MQSDNSNSAQLPQLWFSRVLDSTLAVEQSIHKLLGASEIKRLKSIKSATRCREFLLSRALMRHALSRCFQRPESEWEFVDQSRSGPRVSNLPSNIYLSLSHSSGYIGFALANCPVGIDLEVPKMTRDFPALAEIFMNQEELAGLPGECTAQADYFYRIWCAKESHYKALSATQQSTIAMIDLNYLSFTGNQQNWHLVEGETDQYRFALVTKTKSEKINYYYFPGKTAYLDGVNNIDPIL